MKKIEVGTRADRRCNQAAQPGQQRAKMGKKGEKMRVRGAFSPTSTPSNRMMLLAVEELNSFELRT